MAKSKKGRLITRSDAEEAFDIAQASTDLVRTQRFTMRGMFLRAFADHNKAHGYHLGRPKGTTGAAIDDSEAFAYMDFVSRDTGETRHHTLARLAHRAGKITHKGGTVDSQIKRVAKAWKALNIQK